MIAKVIVIFLISLWTILTFGMLTYMGYEYLLHPNGPWNVLPGTCCEKIERVPLYMHMVGATIMIILGPIQLLNHWCKFRYHPHLGAGYVLGAIINSFGGILFMTFNDSTGKSFMTVPFTVYGVLVFVYSMIVMTLGMYRVKKHHKIWVFRMFVLGTASIFYRILYIVMFLIYGVYDVTFDSPIDRAFNWIFFIVPMFVTEIGIILYYRSKRWCINPDQLIILGRESSSDGFIYPEYSSRLLINTK